MKRSMTISDNSSLNKDEKNKEESILMKRANKLIKRTSKLLKAKTLKPSLSQPSLNYKIEEDEEKEFVEIVLGDYYDFNKINEIPNFTKMTSLSIVNDMVEDMGIIIEKIPNKDLMIYLCLNENYIKEIKNIQFLTNLKQLHLNFNLIKTIDIGVSKIKTLKQFWICDNKIKIIENIPINIIDFWIANNLIENLPSDFNKYIYIESLNLAGNYLIDFNNIYILNKLNNLKVLYLNNCNFGENPICTFANYRMMMIHLFKQIKILDQYKITFEERQESENSYNKKYINYKSKIRENKNLIKKINKLLKGHKLFFKGVKYHLLRAYSQKKKLLEYKLYEIIDLGVNTDIKIEDIKNEIVSIRTEINSCLKEIDFIENSFHIIKKYLSDLNDLSIILYFYEIESYGNYKIEIGNIDLNWVKSCLELINLKIHKDFLEKNKLEVNYNKIYKIINKKVKIIFDSLYDNLIDINNKFGDENIYYDFYFLVLPKEKFCHRKIFHFLFEKQENEKEMILTDNLTLIDNLYLKNNKKNKSFFTIICKCIKFNNMIEEFKSDKKFNSLNEIINEIKGLKSNKEIIKLILTKESNSSFYYYNIQGAVEPIYFVEYEYIEKKNEKNMIISSFNKVIHFSKEHDINFNLNCKELCFEGNKQFFSKEVINKYFFNHFLDLSELDYHIYFFAKNSILNYLNKCFKYQSLKEFKEELKKIKNDINEVSLTPLNKTFKNLIVSTDEKENYCLTQLKTINLFNCGYTDSDLEELFNQILDLSKCYSRIYSLKKRVETIILSNNKLEKINLGFICQLFPNLKEIDISHNHLKEITYEPKETTNFISNIDISFNEIKDFSNVILILKHLNCLSFFKYFANPFDNFSEQNFCNSPLKCMIMKEDINKIISEYEKHIKNIDTKDSPVTISVYSNYENKEMLNFLYIFEQYSYSDKYKNFSESPIFKEKVFQNTSLTRVNLSKKKLFSVPNIQNGKDIGILLLNLNKIQKLNNLEQFSNLIELYLQSNKISQIEKLPKTLKKLDISNNEVNNLKEISTLINLEWLNLENNLIEELDDIENLTNLIEIYLSKNKIKNINECSKFEELKEIKVIDLYSNEICENNNDLRLFIINICPNLQILNRIIVTQNEKEKSNDYFKGKLTNNIFEKRLGFNYNTNNIIELDLSYLKLIDQINLFSKGFYPRLRVLNLSKNNFTSFSIFGILPTLKELKFDYNNFTEILSNNEKIIGGRGIMGLPNLEKLEMSNNQLVNLNGIHYLNNLNTLILKENNFSNIKALNNLKNLTYLDVSNNKIEYFEKVSVGDLPLLQFLICDDNLIKNVNGLSKYKSIKLLSLQNNKIMDLNCLFQLSTLKNINELILRGNPISFHSYYRENIIQLFPSLKQLDCILIEKERENNVNKKYNILKSNNSFLYVQKSMKKNISFNNFGTENNSITLPHIKNPNLSSQNIISFNGISNVNNDKPIKIRKKIISNINLDKK